MVELAVDALVRESFRQREDFTVEQVTKSCILIGSDHLQYPIKLISEVVFASSRTNFNVELPRTHGMIMYVVTQAFFFGTFPRVLHPMRAKKERRRKQRWSRLPSRRRRSRGLTPCQRASSRRLRCASSRAQRLRRCRPMTPSARRSLYDQPQQEEVPGVFDPNCETK